MLVPMLAINIDFNQFFPVQHKKTETFFMLNVVENNDSDVAANNEPFICYPITDEGQTSKLTKFIFLKEELQPIPLLL